jgi:hypothetical protein
MTEYTWRATQSKTDTEMYAVEGCYLVADNLPIEDARLISAAPDMLEALKEAEGELYQVPPADAEQERVLGVVRAAIAKAKGQ